MINPPDDSFAKTSLKKFAHQGTFTVEITGDEEGEAMARAFECLGCTVEPKPFDYQIRVTAPANQAIVA